MDSNKWPPCDVCGKAVTTASGTLVCVMDEINRYKAETERWEQEHTDELGVVHIGGDMPRRVRWHWGHSRCVPDGWYVIEGSRIDTIGKALSWTLHLMKKEWLSYTNWEETVRRLHHVGGT